MWPRCDFDKNSTVAISILNTVEFFFVAKNMQNRIENLDQRGLRLLALDDGGILGLSELLIIKEIMSRVQNIAGLSSLPRPCDYFDLIGGVGTGG